MKIKDIREIVLNKDNFKSVQNYIDFGKIAVEFFHNVENYEAKITAINEHNYKFYQYKSDAGYTITRPVNERLFLNMELFEQGSRLLISILEDRLRLKGMHEDERLLFNNMVYTIQQCIGCSLDSLGQGEGNKAKKINGERFERFIIFLFKEMGFNASGGVQQVPIRVNGEEMFKMQYQHDLIISDQNGRERLIGSIKTSGKDRLDKIFIDKFLYNNLMNTSVPHIAIFLNDVQRNGKHPKFKINSTFLPGHFKGYTIKLCPLDGVFYCDLRPDMKYDEFLKQHIKRLDTLFCEDIWNLLIE